MTKQRFVKPWGATVTPKAETLHGTSNATLEASGGRSDAVLRKFLRDVLPACQCGGRVISHHLEFDAGIIMNELERCGLAHLQSEWASAVRQGTCTMDPGICRWVHKCFGREATGTHIPLRGMVLALVENGEQLLAKHHAAGADAQMHRLVYGALNTLAKKASNSICS